MPRPRLLGAVLAALATLLALALLAPAAEARAKVPADFFGISATLPSEGDYAGMGEAGFGAFRFDINWAAVQRTRKGGYDWSGTDATVRLAASNGMEPTPILLGTPRFVKANADGLYPPTASSANKASWKRFLEAAATRYGRDGEFWAENPGVPQLAVRDWLIWNEQNARAFWKPKPNPRDYATLVKISDQAISSVDRSGKIVLGGMFGYPKDERSFTAVDFLRRFYEKPGIEKHFDSIGVHPYGAGVATVRTQVLEARKAARNAGDPNAGILVGEIGWASSGPKSSEEVVGAQGQSKRLRDGLELLVKKRRAWNIDGAIVYVWRDFSPEFTACLWCPFAGLVEEGGASKPALSTVRDVIRSSR